MGKFHFRSGVSGLCVYISWKTLILILRISLESLIDVCVCVCVCVFNESQYLLYETNRIAWNDNLFTMDTQRIVSRANNACDISMWSTLIHAHD